VTVTGIGTPNGAPIPADSVLVAGENPSGNQMVLQTDSNGDLLVSPLTSSSTVTVVQPTGSNLHADIDSSVLPTGASTSALQTTGNTSLSTIATNTTGVSTAANQTAGNASLATIATNTTGVSTAANQTTGNTSLATIATNQTSGGQKTQLFTPTALTITQKAITVGTTAVRLTVSGSTPATDRVVLVGTPDVASTGTFYIGSSTVLSTGTTRGIEISPGQAFIANNDAGDYWIVSSVAAQTVTVMEQS
jgi:hypothetical protein